MTVQKLLNDKGLPWSHITVDGGFSITVNARDDGKVAVAISAGLSGPVLAVTVPTVPDTTGMSGLVWFDPATVVLLGVDRDVWDDAVGWVVDGIGQEAAA